jgi:basic membrane protein A
VSRRNLAKTVLAAIVIGLGLRYLLAPPVYRIGMVLPSDPNQPGWSSAVLASAGVIERRLAQEGAKAQIDYTIALTDSTAALTLLAGEGYDFIIAADDSYAAAAREVARQYPERRFALLGDDAGNGANLAAITLRHAELGEAAGRVMALKTATGKVAYLADGPNPRRREALQGLRQGLGPEAALQIHWNVGNPAEASALAARLFDSEGVDVICIDADIQTMLAVYEAASQRPGKYVSNWYVDLSSLFPDTTLGAYSPAPADILAQAAGWSHTGEWPGRRYSFGTGDNALNLLPVHNLTETRTNQVWSTWAEIYDREFAQ